MKEELRAKEEEQRASYRIVVIIAVNTGEILDMHIMCNVCSQCSKRRDRNGNETIGMNITWAM